MRASSAASIIMCQLSSVLEDEVVRSSDLRGNQSTEQNTQEFLSCSKEFFSCSFHAQKNNNYCFELNSLQATVHKAVQKNHSLPFHQGRPQSNSGTPTYCTVVREEQILAHM